MNKDNLIYLSAINNIFETASFSNKAVSDITERRADKRHVKENYGYTKTIQALLGHAIKEAKMRFFEKIDKRIN